MAGDGFLLLWCFQREKWGLLHAWQRQRSWVGTGYTDNTSLEISRAWGFTTTLQGNLNSVEGVLVPDYSLSPLVKPYKTWGWVRIQAATLHLCPIAAHTLWQMRNLHAELSTCLSVCIDYPQHCFLLTQITVKTPEKQDFLPWYMNSLQVSLEILFLFNFNYHLYYFHLYFVPTHISCQHIVCIGHIIVLLRCYFIYFLHHEVCG